jgi:hypothetical protein
MSEGKSEFGLGIFDLVAFGGGFTAGLTDKLHIPVKPGIDFMLMWGAPIVKTVKNFVVGGIIGGAGGGIIGYGTSEKVSGAIGGAAVGSIGVGALAAVGGAVKGTVEMGIGYCLGYATGYIVEQFKK